MRRAFCPVTVVALVFAAVTEGQAALEIEHAALACVPVDRYARVAGRATPGVGRAELQFRADPAGGWYSVRMVEQGGEWAAFLPRPTSAVRQIEYRIVTIGPDAGTRTSPVVSVPVREAAACEGDARPAVESPIVITVPEGAPAIPPVPAGFAPAGVVVAEEKRGLSRGMKISAAGAGVAVLGATAAAVAGSTTPPRPNPIVLPELRFNAIAPVPGSTVARNRDTVVVSMVMSHEPTFPLSLGWRVEFVSSSAGRTCLQMDGFLVGVQRPLALALTGPLVSAPNGGCGLQAFDTDTIRITVGHQDQLFHDVTHAFAYRFVP